MFGLSPYLLGGAAIAALLAFGGGYIKGNADTANRYQVKIDRLQIDARDSVQKVRDEMSAQANSAIASLETKNEAARVVYRTITQQVDRVVEMPLYRDRCFDDAGVRLANLALAGVAVAPPSPGDPDNRMPRSLAPQ